MSEHTHMLFVGIHKLFSWRSSIYNVNKLENVRMAKLSWHVRSYINPDTVGSMCSSNSATIDAQLPSLLVHYC